MTMQPAEVAEGAVLEQKVEMGSQQELIRMVVISDIIMAAEEAEEVMA